MKISASCLLGLCLLAWTSGCGCTRQHARCVEWDGPNCPNCQGGCDQGCSTKSGLTQWLKPQCKHRHHVGGLFGGCPECEPAACCGPVAPGCCESAGMPMMHGGAAGNCGGGEPVMMGGPVPADAGMIGPAMDAGGCAGCAGGQVPQVPPAKVSGHCVSCGSSVSGAPQPPTTGWSPSGSFGIPASNTIKPPSSGCATGNCQGAVIGEGIIYDNVTTPAPTPMPTPVTSYNPTISSTALQNAPPPPPPLPGGN